ncbi:MAG: tetratricopeptide repeat protein [Verrucomicrobiales bacterium]
MDEPSWLDKARGYLDLGMLDAAWNEIESLPPDKRGCAEAQEMRIVIQLERGALEEALALCEILCDVAPGEHAGYIQGAYCLHELGRTDEAIEHLQSGPQTLREEAVYFYNLGCYELAVGREQAAIAWLDRSFDLDHRFRKHAKTDPDLESIRGYFSD